MGSGRPRAARESIVRRVSRGVGIAAALVLVLGVGCAPAPESLEVTATAYNSLPRQTLGDPQVTAWGHRLEPGMNVIAVSRDLIPLGLTDGVEVRIDGMPGHYVVRDKLNRRFKKRIDIYMGTDRAAAREWGKRTVTITWRPPRDRER